MRRGLDGYKGNLAGFFHQTDNEAERRHLKTYIVLSYKLNIYLAPIEI